MDSRQLYMPVGHVGGRSDRGAIRIGERDVDVLAWAGEQYAARLDVLAIVLGRQAQATTRRDGRLSLRGTRRVVNRWRRAGLVEVDSFQAGAPGWVWPVRAGLQVAGLGWRAWRPRRSKLAHVHAVAAVRLYVEARHPGATWVCERTLRAAAADRHRHVADGEVSTDDGRIAAVEVELTPKSRRRVTKIVGELLAGYEWVWYFATPAAARVVEAVAGTVPGAEGRVFVRPLADVADALDLEVG